MAQLFIGVNGKNKKIRQNNNGGNDEQNFFEGKPLVSL